MEVTPDDRKEFYLEEVKSLREKMNGVLIEARALERHALVLTGVVWAWLLPRIKEIPEVSLWIPFFLCSLALLREAVLYLEIRDLTRYIRRTEERFLGPQGGWESDVETANLAVTLWNRRFRVPWAAIAFWGILIAGTLLGPLWLIRR